MKIVGGPQAWVDRQDRSSSIRVTSSMSYNIDRVSDCREAVGGCDFFDIYGDDLVRVIGRSLKVEETSSTRVCSVSEEA